MTKKAQKPAWKYVHARKDGPFEEAVNEAIAEGYFPVGGVDINERYLYSQGMIRRDLLVTLHADAVRKGTPITTPPSSPPIST